MGDGVRHGIFILLYLRKAEHWKCNLCGAEVLMPGNKISLWC